MANAIHKTNATDTLQLVARQYYNVLKPTGAADLVQQALVIRAIRKATPTTLTNLAGVADNAVIGVDKTLFVPTLRQLNRSLLLPASLPAAMSSAFKSKGIRHARKMLRRKTQTIIDLMAPTYTDSDVRKAYFVTGFFNLDGMDPYTATYLYETQGITSLAMLAQTSVGTLASILNTLVASNARPSQLTQQRHAERWPIEAKLYSRSGIGEYAKLHWSRQFTPHISPSFARGAAEYHERAARRTDQEAAVGRTANAMRVIYRLQEKVSAGHRALLSGRNREAISRYEAAREILHGWLYEVGMVAAPVNPNVGVSVNTLLLGVKRLLEALADGDVDDPDAPIVPGGRRPASRYYGVRGFRFDELKPGEKTALTGEPVLAGRKLRSFPPEFRRLMARIVLDKTRSELALADANLTQGLSAASSDVLVRDFDPDDRQRVVRNLGGANFSVILTSGMLLLDRPELQDALRLSAIKSLVSGTFWSGLTASDKLNPADMARYPSWLAAESPFVRFVVLPPLEGGSTWQAVRVGTSDAGFQVDWVDQFLKIRLKSTKAADLYPSREVWESPSAFAVWIPWLYGKVLQRGLALAHSRVGLTHTASSELPNPSRLVNFYDAAGLLVGADRHNATSNMAAIDNDLVMVAVQLPATPDTFEELQSWVQTQVAEADFLYGMDDLTGARSLYQEVVTGVELFDPPFDAEESDASDAVAEHSHSGDVIITKPPSLFDFLDQTDGRTLLSGIDRTGTSDPFGSALHQDSAAAARTMFGWNFAVAVLDDLPSTEVDTVLASSIMPGYVSGLGWTLNDDEGYKAYLWERYLHANAMIKMIDLGLNAIGYRPDYVPPWAADHMYTVARDMCNRARVWSPAGGVLIPVGIAGTVHGAG